MKKTNVLIGISGSLDVLAISSYLSSLQDKFSNLKLILSESAEQIIAKEAWSPYATEVYSSRLFPFPEVKVSHIQIAAWADLLFVLPADATVLSQSALGLANNLLSLVILSHQHPVVFLPNLNEPMWMNPATQKNISLLREYGHRVIDPSYRDSRPLLPSAQKFVCLINEEIERRTSR